MSDFKEYIFVLIILGIIIAGSIFEKQSQRLCVQEAIHAKYHTKDIVKLCGVPYVSLGDKE